MKSKMNSLWPMDHPRETVERQILGVNIFGTFPPRGRHYGKNSKHRWPGTTPTAKCRGRRRRPRPDQLKKIPLGYPTALPSAQRFFCFFLGYTDGKAVSLALFILLTHRFEHKFCIGIWISMFFSSFRRGEVCRSTSSYKFFKLYSYKKS